MTCGIKHDLFAAESMGKKTINHLLPPEEANTLECEFQLNPITLALPCAGPVLSIYVKAAYWLCTHTHSKRPPSRIMHSFIAPGRWAVFSLNG